MFSANRIARFIEKNKVDLLHAHVARLSSCCSCRSVDQETTRHNTTRDVPDEVVPPAGTSQCRSGDRRIPADGPASGTHLPAKEDRDDPEWHRPRRPWSDRAAKAAEFRTLHSIPADAPLIVTLGELRLLKGQRDLVLAANEVLKYHNDAYFVIAGRDHSIDQKFRRELKRLVKVLGIEDRFVWLDWLDDISPLLAAADLFVSPSHSESFGLAILDAMAAGTAVVATETDGAEDTDPRTSRLGSDQGSAGSRECDRYVFGRCGKASDARRTTC